MKKPEKTFRGTIELLYIVCILGWDLCLKHLTDFAAFSPNYTAALIAARKQAVEDADKITDQSGRNADGTSARQQLDDAILAVCKNWQQLKRYIIRASTPGSKTPNLQKAGFDYYSGAAKGKWDEAKPLIKNANEFMLANLAMLKANNNMPDAFVTAFATDGNTCAQLAKQCLETEADKPLVTDDKIMANNQIFADLMTMLSDSKIVYAGEPGMKRLFTFTHLTRIASGTKPGAIKGTATNSLTGKPIPNVYVSVENEPYTSKADKKGKYAMKKVAAGTYMVKFAAPGFEPIMAPVTVKASTAATLNIALQATEEVLKVA